MALAGGAALLAALTGLAPQAASAADQVPDGLFGSGDPQADGVWRQSIALLAQHAVGATPADEAVEWLAGQQCADGSFLGYRADPSVPCEDVSAADSNATALAAQALAALGGHDDAVDAALTWLTGVQNADGGWSYNPGMASDTNSTAVVIGAFVSAGEDPAEVVRDDHSPYDALGALQLGCDAAEDQRGSFAWQPDAETGALTGNASATADAVLALYGAGLLVSPDAEEAAPAEALDCGTQEEDDTSGTETGDTGTEDTEGGDTEEGTPTDGATDPADGTAEEVPAHITAASAGSAQLTALLTANDQHLVSTLPGSADAEQPDYGTTVKTVLALAAGGHRDAAGAPLTWLRENAAAWPDLQASPSALGLLILAAHATDTSATDFGGTDLVAALNELGPTPESGAASGDEEEDSDTLATVIGGIVGAVVVLGLLAVAGGVVRRRRSHEDGNA